MPAFEQKRSMGRRLRGLCDQGYDVAFAGDVGLDGEAVDLIRDFPRRVEIDV